MPPGTDTNQPAPTVEPEQTTGVKPAGIHWRSLILHHKVLMVNGNLMVAGSFNWSPSAERRNLEDVMVFDGRFPGHQHIIDQMHDEFEFLWNCSMPQPPLRQQNTQPQIVDGPTARRLITTILDTLAKPDMKPIMEAVDAARNGITLNEIVTATKLDGAVVRDRLEDLVQVGMLYSHKTGRGIVYGLAD